MSIRVKICGVRRVQDAIAAAEAGCDAVGMVFHPPAFRCVDDAVAREIVRSTPAFISVVGLFVDDDPQHIASVAEDIGLTHVQLHGDEHPGAVERLPRWLRVLKAIRVDDDVEASLQCWRDRRSDIGHRLAGIILESPGVTGGSGVANNFARVAELQLAGKLDGLGTVILAGGLNPTNVAGAIQQTSLHAVDVSSGVEQVKGEKDAALLHEFITTAKTAHMPVDQD